MNTPTPQKSLEKIHIYPVPSDFEAHVITMPSVILVFSTLLLDEEVQNLVVLPKQELTLHLPSKFHQNVDLPVFHFITLCQPNIKHQSVMIIDSEHEIQFGFQQPNNNIYTSNGIASAVITLHQPAQETKYLPYLVDSTFENVNQLKDLILADGYLSTKSEPIVQCDWAVSTNIPIPMEIGNLFFPSFPFHNIDDLSNPFYDTAPVPFRYANDKLFNLVPSKQANQENKQSLDNFARCENIIQPCQYVFYDEVIAEVIMKNFKIEELVNIQQEYVYCPFTFPAQSNLHHMIVHPDTLFIQQQKPILNIFRKHRSPVFNIISKLSISEAAGNKTIILSPVCLYAFIQEKELFFSFTTHLSATYKISDHTEKYLALFSRRPRKKLSPRLWESDSVSFNYLVASLNPIRLNLDGSAEAPTKFLQPRTIHVDRLSPVSTVSQLCNKFAPFSIGSSTPQEKPTEYDEGVNNPFKPNISFQPPIPTRVDKAEETNLSESNFAATSTTSNVLLNFPELDPMESDFPYDESNPNLIPLNSPGRTEQELCLSDYLENEHKSKIPKQKFRISPFPRVAKYPRFDFPQSTKRENDKLDVEVNECLKELDEFLTSLDPLALDNVEETPNQGLKNQHSTSNQIPDNTDDPYLRRNILHTPEVDLKEQTTINSYEICALTTEEKTLFLFETEFKDRTVREQQVPKLMAQIKLGNEHGEFEDITALVDSGSDVTLITLNRLRSLVSQEFIQDNIEKENAVLTSFTNTGIKILGKLLLRFKLNNNGPTKAWKFLIISQNSVIDMIIGNDMLMHFCMSIQVKSKNKPEIILPNNEPVATFYSRINEINECQKDVKLKPGQKAYIKITPHPAFTAFRNERLLVEGTMESAHLVVPLACKILPDGRLPLAVVNSSNKEILEKIRVTITRMAPDQKIIGHRDIKDIQVYTLMVPVQISNHEAGLEIKSAECTKELNVYKMDVQHIPSQRKIPYRTGLAKGVKVSKKETGSKTTDPNQGGQFVKHTNEILQKDKDNTSNEDLSHKDRIPVKVSNQKEKGMRPTDKVLPEEEDSKPDENSSQGDKYSPENFWKDMDGKFLPPGYEVFQNSSIEDIIKLSEYPPLTRKYIKDIFIDKYSEIISKNDYEIGQLSKTLGLIKLHLKPGVKLPPFKRIYYLEQTQAQALKDILSYLIKEDIIEPCGVNDNSGFNGFSSPAYLVSKANPEKSAYRLIVNYKNLNQELLLTPPILPSISQYLQKLRRGYVFSQFDLSSAFYSLTLDKESRKLTMFSTCFGNFKFRSLAMGLATSPGAFCHIANDLIHTEPVLDETGNPVFTSPGMVKRVSSPLDFACIYFDDVCIYSTLQATYEETVKVHFECIEKVMKRLFFHKAKLKWSKTELLKTEIIFLGHKISNGRAYADPRRIEKLLNAKFPSNLNLLRSFLGLLNSLRSYLPPTISKNMATLQELTSTKKGFNPIEKHQKAFENLKSSLTREPLFTSIVDPAGHYYLFCDAASGEKASFSAVLTQVIRDRENEYPPFLNQCDPLHNYIYKHDLRYRPIPLYLGSERICKTKVDRKTYDPIFIPSYYEKKNLGFSELNLHRTWFVAIQSIYYDMGYKFLSEAEVRKEAVLLCKKGLLIQKIKTYCHGGHHNQTKQYLQDFQDGKANIDNFLFMIEVIAEAIKRTIILICADDSGSVTTQVLNANEKSELIIGVYTVGGQKLFYPFKKVDADTLRVYDFQNRIQIVGFYSKSIPQGTALLDIAQIEALGLLFTLEHYRPYIKMSKLTLITDNLVFFAILSRRVLDCSTIMARYALKILVSYPQCRIRHILTSHNLADFLTRENKIDKNTLLRLPLSAFTVDNELSRKINQKRDYTFLEMRDFCDENQKFIQIQPDAMGKKRVSVRKYDRIENEQNKTLLSLTYDTKNQSSYYDTEDEIVTLINEPEDTYINDNPFHSMDSVCPQIKMESQVNVVTRSGKTNTENENKNKQTRSKRKRTKKNKEVIHNQNANSEEVTVNAQSNKETEKDANYETTTSDKNDISKVSNKDKQQDKTGIDAEKTENIENQSPDSYTYQGQKATTNSDLQKAENRLDKISHPNPRINRSGEAIYPKVDPFLAQQSLVELLILRTSHQNLMAGQKDEFKDIIEQCRLSKDFKFTKAKGTYMLKNSLLYYQDREGEEKIALPPSLYGFVIGATHIIKQHPGVKRMCNELSMYHIPGLTNLLNIYISSCFSCFLNNRQKSAQLGHVPIIRSGYCFHVDLAEGLPSNNGYKHILLCVDPFSKLLLTFPLKEKTSSQVLPYMIHTIFQMFFCRMVISDGGPCFSSSEFRKAMSDLCIVHKIVSAHHPQSNSHAESKVKRLKDMLRKMLAAENSTDWLARLPLATKSLNCCKLGEVNLSPLEILYGINQPNSQHTLTTPSQTIEVPPYKSATEIQAKMKPVIEKYKKLINERNVNRKKKINKTLKNPNIKVGSYIIIKDFAILKGINKTLHNLYKNEFFIVERVKPRSVVAKSLTTYQSKLIAYSHIKVVNKDNFEKLDVPPVLWKLLIQDSRMLTQADKLFISSNSQAFILPEPSPEAISDFISDDEEEIDFEESTNPKAVTFDLDNNESTDDPENTKI